MLPRTACSSCLLHRAVAHTEAGEEREGFRGDKGVGAVGRHQVMTRGRGENEEWVASPLCAHSDCEENPERLLKK